MKILPSLYLVCTQDIPFDAVEFQQRYCRKFLYLVTQIKRLFPKCAVDFRATYRKNNTVKFDAEGFVTAASLKVVVGLPSSFIRFFFGRTRNILSVV